MEQKRQMGKVMRLLTAKPGDRGGIRRAGRQGGISSFVTHLELQAFFESNATTKSTSFIALLIFSASESPMAISASSIHTRTPCSFSICAIFLAICLSDQLWLMNALCGTMFLRPL
jgi:hypothetical protein